MRTLLVICLAIILAACAESRSFLRYEEQGPTQVWPQAPEAPRYRYVGQLTGDENVYTESTGRFAKFLKWITGQEGADRVRTVLQRPQSGVVDEARGRIYVTDVSRQGVFVFDEPNGNIQFWDRASPALGFASPVGIALRKDGQLLVVDADLGIVARLDPSGEPLGTFGDGVLKRPTGIAIDPKTGRVYVSDTHAHNIKVFNEDGTLREVFGQRGEGVGEFNFPTFIAFANNNLYVTDTLNSRVQVLNSEGEYLLKFGRRGINIGDLPRPKGVCVDRAGRVYVVESYYDHLLVYSPDGQLLLPIGGTGSDVGQFYLPSGVWTDSKDRVYVADMFNGRVVIFEYIGDKAK